MEQRPVSGLNEMGGHAEYYQPYQPGQSNWNGNVHHVQTEPVELDGQSIMSADHFNSRPASIMSTQTLSPRKRGKLIVFEGLDRSGKSTQAERLVDTLRSRGDKVEHMRFPNRSTAIGQMISAYLGGQSQAEDHVIHMLFSANRWELAGTIEDAIYSGRTVIVDRYYYSGCVYSAAKENPTLSLEWARQPEVGLPRPDLCIFLDISPEMAAERGGFGQERYEKQGMQECVRDLFEQLREHADEDNDMVVVNAERTTEDVERTIRKWVRLASERVDQERLPLGHVRPW